jgi:hypothetical protein
MWNALNYLYSGCDSALYPTTVCDDVLNPSLWCWTISYCDAVLYSNERGSASCQYMMLSSIPVYDAVLYSGV